MNTTHPPIYLFDFDGTLVDSMPTYAGVMLRILDECGVSYGDDLVKIITPLGFKDTAKYYINMGVQLPYEEIVRRMGEYAIDAYTNDVQAKEGVIETLRALKERGDDLHVLTASPHVTLDPCLKRLGIWDLFTNVWSCNDFDTNKSDPDIYRRAAEKIGRPVEEIIFLDDNYNADKTAREAGMQVWGVYDDTSAEYEAEIRSVTQRYIRDFREILAE